MKDFHKFNLRNNYLGWKFKIFRKSYKSIAIEKNPQVGTLREELRKLNEAYKTIKPKKSCTNIPIKDLIWVQSKVLPKTSRINISSL